MMLFRGALLVVLIFIGSMAKAQDASPIKAWLGAPVVGAETTQAQLQDYIEARVPRLPKVQTAAQWRAFAHKTRDDVLTNVVFRGEAAQWRDAPLRVEWLETMPGGPDYRVKKLRYEAVPGLWIPAVLYEPASLSGKVPLGMAVNGHDSKGKSATYKQIRCINMAKRGMIVLNPEWLGMGQLAVPGNRHGCLNQLDLCGTGGLSVFFLAMSRGLDLLLAHPNADPARVAVSGLSGGGWQTIFISSLDTRVTLSNPVAGYSSFRTRVRHFKDLGDSEQTPCDLGRYADYTHLTAMLAPRAALLTYNSKDNCCFESGYALPPLRDAAEPVYRLLDAGKKLRTHVNDVPGTHNFEQDNREAYYRLLCDTFFAGEDSVSAKEIACPKELKTTEELAVKLPPMNATMNSLALSLAKNLPRNPGLPAKEAGVRDWQARQHAKLREVLRNPDWNITDAKVSEDTQKGTTAKFWRFATDRGISFSAVEFRRGKPKGTVILVSDGGRAALTAEVERLLAAGHCVLAVDPFYFGDAALRSHGYLFALLLGTIGERPLGWQSGQVAAVARWASENGHRSIAIHAFGPRSSVIALAAAALETKTIESARLTGSLGSLKEVIEANRSFDQAPELFTFGLLEYFDVRQMVALTAPRPVTFLNPSDRVRAEMAELPAWYSRLGRTHDPVKPD